MGSSGPIILPFGFPLSVLLLPSTWYKNLTAFTNSRYASKKLLTRIWPKKGRFPMVAEGDFNCRPTGRQIAEICFQKAPRPRFGPKGPFPNGPRRGF
jgi:hypothetical protein